MPSTNKKPPLKIFPMLKKATLHEAELLCKEDPVRPNIPYHWRVAGLCREIYYLKLPDWVWLKQSLSTNESIHAGSVICAAYLQDIPINEDELMTIRYGQSYAIFYSFWSNKKGQGKILIQQVIQYLQNKYKHTEFKGMRYITMSPKTQMAMDFHIKNGAKLLYENPLTYNFEYRKTIKW